MKKWRRRMFLAVFIGIVTIPFLVINSHALLSAAGRWLDVGGTPQRADAVVLLNGGYNTRPFVAAALVRGGWTPKVLLNTVALHALEADGTIPRSHEIALRVLEYGGVRRSEVKVLDVRPKPRTTRLLASRIIWRPIRRNGCFWSRKGLTRAGHDGFSSASWRPNAPRLPSSPRRPMDSTMQSGGAAMTVFCSSLANISSFSSMRFATAG